VIRKLPVRIAAAGAGLMLAGGVAVASAGSPPEAADEGLSTAEEHTGFLPPASQDSHPTAADHPGGGAEDATELEATEDETAKLDEPTEELGGGPVDNHGAEVSAVAQSEFETGREHGEAVSEVARGDHGPDAAGEAAESAQP
jgi:hypothetical protein